MVPAQHDYIIREALLHGKQEEYDLWTVIASINVVAQHQDDVCFIFRFEQFLQHTMDVVELPMNISDNCDFAFNLH